MRKVLFFIIAGIAIAQIAYMVLEQGLRKFNRYYFERRTELFENNREFDVIFLGSSRTQVQINPCIFDSITGFTSYNFGMKGCNSFEALIILRGYLENHPAPNYLIYNIDHPSVREQHTIPNSEMYLFFAHNNAVYQGLNKMGYPGFWIRYIPFTRLFYFDDYLRNIAIQGWLGKSQIKSGSNYCRGHESELNDRVDPSTLDTITDIPFQGHFQYVDEMLRVCNENKIQLVFHQTPIIYRGDKPTSGQSISGLESYCEDRGILLWRFDTVKTYGPDLFYDEVHLNKTGSEKYSAEIARKFLEHL
ncbi:MAG: hypothetical protein ACPF8V_00085 [Luteibaculum sp.]